MSSKPKFKVGDIVQVHGKTGIITEVGVLICIRFKNGSENYYLASKVKYATEAEINRDRQDEGSEMKNSEYDFFKKYGYPIRKEVRINAFRTGDYITFFIKSKHGMGKFALESKVNGEKVCELLGIIIRTDKPCYP